MGSVLTRATYDVSNVTFVSRFVSSHTKAFAIVLLFLVINAAKVGLIVELKTSSFTSTGNLR